MVENRINVHYICLETKTFGPKAQGLSRALTLLEYLDVLVKYNIIQYNHIAMSVRERSTPCAAESRQQILAKDIQQSSSRKDDYDCDVGA